MPNASRFAVLFLTPFLAVGSPAPVSIPRSPSTAFRSEGLFEGGRETRANLESLRVARHAKEGFERWVIDFSDGKAAGKAGAAEKRQPQSVAPRFHLEYTKARKFLKDDGSEVTERPAKFVLLLRSIGRNLLTKERLAEVVRKSRYVKEIVLYPPVEQGDMALELVLNDDVRFAPFQPIEREGRLVLDLKSLQ